MSETGCGEYEVFPSRDVLNRIGDRWTIRVMRALQERRVLRYTELEALIPGVSRKMLTQTLRAIERDGMVTRTVYPQVPPHVDYRLTDLGLSALEPIDVLCRWSARHLHEVEGARVRYDGAGSQSGAPAAGSLGSGGGR